MDEAAGRLLDLLNGVAAAIDKGRNTEEVLEPTLRHICTFLGWPVGHVFLQQGNEGPVSTALWHIDDPARFEIFRRLTEVAHLEPGQGLPGRVAESAEALWIPDVTEDADFPRASLAEHVGIRAAIGVPVRVRREVVAVLEFFATQREEPDPFVLRVLDYVGTQLGWVVERSRSGEALRQNEERTRRIVEGAHDPFVAVDEAGLIIDWNAEAERTFGWLRHEVYEQPLVETIIPAEDREDDAQGLVRFLTGGEGPLPSERCELRVLHRDGHPFRVEMTVVPIRLGNAQVFGAFLHDISHRARAEQALQQQDEYFRALIENAADLITVVEADGTVRYVSPSVKDTMGFEAGELVGRPLSERVHPDDLTAWATLFDRLLHQPGADAPAVVRFAHGSGGWRVFGVRGTSLLQHPAVRGIVLNSRDITAFTESQTALEEQQRAASTLMRNLPGMAYRCRNDPEWPMEFVSAGAAELLGYPPETLAPGGSVTYGELIHPDDREAVWSAVQAGLAEHRPFRMEYRVRSADGAEKWVWEQGQGVYSPAGELAALEGFVTEISDRKRSEGLVRSSEAELRAIVTAMTDVILVLDSNGRYIKIPPTNPALLYKPPAELVGKTLHEVLPRDAADAFLGIIREVLRTQETARTEYCLPIEGSEFWFSASISPMLDDSVVWVARDITDSKKAEETQARLASIVESSDDAIVSKSPKGIILTWNAGAERLYGYSAEEIIGESAVRLLAHDRPDEEARIMERIQRGEHVKDYETVRLRKDGSEVHVSLTFSPIRNRSGAIVGASAIARDIGEQRQAAAELRASNERYRMVGRVTHDAIWDWDVRADTLQWGDGIHSTFEYAQADVRHELDWWASRIHSDDLQGVLDSLDAAIAAGDEAWTREYRFLRGDGSYADVEDRGLIVRDPAGIALRMIGSVADISVRKRVETSLLRAKEAAEAANRAKSDFLSSMSHELRTPLNSVIGFTNVLAKNKGRTLNEKDLNYLDRILANGKHLLGLINDILDLSKIEAGKMELELAPVAVDRLLSETLTQLRGTQHTRTVRLVSHTPERVALAETDAGKLKQILINLLDNAFKFTEAGSVTVRLDVDPDTHRPTRIEVADTGIGIPAERLTSIFQPFEQAESGTARRFGGTGLGLAISSSLCLLLGFRLEVRSAVGEGSVFTILLNPSTDPAVGGAERPGRRRDPSPSTVSPPDGEFREKLVLVIDDEIDSRMLLSHHLEELGCRTIAASSGEQGLRIAREFEPDLITVDLLLPGMDGWETIRHLKEDPELRSIPVVVISVVAAENRGSVLGAVDLLDKPVERGDLLAVLHRHLGKEEGRVLIVDDEEDARLLIATYLQEREGIEIRTASDGREGLRVLREFVPDLILLDLLMPGMDGISFLREVRSTPLHADIPVVVVTSKKLSAGDRSTLESQTAAVLSKGGDLEEELRRVLAQRLGRVAGDHS